MKYLFTPPPPPPHTIDYSQGLISNNKWNICNQNTDQKLHISNCIIKNSNGSSQRLTDAQISHGIKIPQSGQKYFNSS